MTARAVIVLLAGGFAGTAGAAAFQVNRVDTTEVAIGRAIATAADGTMFVAGQSLTGPTSSLTMAGVWRYGPAGGPSAWNATASGVTGGTAAFSQSARAIAVGPGSGTAYDVIVGGVLYPGAVTGGDAWLARYSSTGSTVWSVLRNGGASETDAINALALAPSGEIIVAGCSGVTPGDRDAWIARYDMNGSFLGEYAFMAAFGADEELLAVTTDASGSVYVAGWVTIPGAGRNAFVAKFDAALSAPLWTQSVNGASSSTDYYAGVTVDPVSGAVYVVGATTGALPFTDILVTRYDGATGDPVWTLTLDGGEGDHDAAAGCALAADGDLVVAGNVDRPTATFSDVWLARFAPDGSLRWELTRTNQNAYIDEALGVAVDAAGTVRATGLVRGFQTTNADDPRIWIGSAVDQSPVAAVTAAAGTYAMPNPYRPGSGGAFDATGITFRGLAAGATVRVFTATGGRVVEVTDTDGDGVVRWDATGGGGDPVASGVYLWVADGSAGMARGKVVIVR